MRLLIVEDNEETVAEQDKAGRNNGSRLMLLWAVVSGLWTVATVLRIDSVWVSLVGWQNAVEDPFLWINLILPPSMFAVILAAIHQIKTARK